MIESIRLSNGLITQVDAEDFHKFGGLRWYAQESKTCNGTKFYVFRIFRLATRCYKKCYLHRVILDAEKGSTVDHIDGNPLNNTRENLRIVTPTENRQNGAKRTGASTFKGVSWYKAAKLWTAQIRAEGKKIHLGYFKNEIEAARVYDRNAVKYFGDMACVNFPDDFPEIPGLPCAVRNYSSLMEVTNGRD